MCGDGLGEVRDSNHAYKFVKLAKYNRIHRDKYNSVEVFEENGFTMDK